MHEISYETDTGDETVVEKPMMATTTVTRTIEGNSGDTSLGAARFTAMAFRPAENAGCGFAAWLRRIGS